MRTLSLILLPLLVGCTESSLHGLKDGEGGPDAQIEVTPEYVDFGMVGSDVDTVSRTFVIRSVGTEDLDVTGITLQGEDAFSFMIATADTSFLLPSGAEREIQVLYAATGSDGSSAEASIASNAADNEIKIVQLVGQPAVPDLQVSPDPLEFGNAYIGCDRTNDVELTNVGAETLIVDSLSWSGDDTNMGFVGGDFELPLVLEPGESVWASFWFNPSDQIEYGGELVALTNEPEGETRHEQFGSGIYAGAYTDSWEMPYDPPADIMFAVDQSCSMDDDALEDRVVVPARRRFTSQILLQLNIQNTIGRWHCLERVEEAVFRAPDTSRISPASLRGEVINRQFSFHSDVPAPVSVAAFIEEHLHLDSGSRIETFDIDRQ